MTNNIRQPGALRRLLQLLIETSEAAVAIHYSAPWTQDVPRHQGRERRRVAVCYPSETNCLAT